MSVLAFMIPVALLLGLCGLAAFIWSLKTGQYEDLDGASLRILLDDDSSIIPSDRLSQEDDSSPKKS